MKLTEKCVLLPYERYEMLLKTNTEEQRNINSEAEQRDTSNLKDTLLKQETDKPDNKKDIKEDFNTEPSKENTEPSYDILHGRGETPSEQSSVSDEARSNIVSSEISAPPPGLPQNKQKKTRAWDQQKENILERPLETDLEWLQMTNI